MIRFAAIAIALNLGACASTPDYVPANDADDYGHYSTPLGDNRYRIVYNGKHSTGLNTTRDYALLHAAELTLQEGNDWFQVVDRESSTIHRSNPSTNLHDERAYHVERSCGLLGCTRSVRPATYASVGYHHRSPESKHNHALEIVMGKGEMPSGDGNYYDASDVAQALWASM
ncbi:MAG: hypothetical protein U5K76_03145 [Woeseiaceae bacterium]|nr:hypothetical protein [Woeseiaceae bacterium]